MLVNDFLQNSAIRFPDKVALICNGRRLTYSQIDGLSNQLANELMTQGTARGEVVAVYLKNSIEAVVGIFAILKAGGHFVVIDRSVKSKKLRYILHDCQAAGVITDAMGYGIIAEDLAEFSSVKFAVLTDDMESPKGNIRCRTLHQVFDSNKASLPGNRCIDIDLAAIIYTSGSTGNPKGVMLTHLNMVSAATSITQYLENESSDIIISVLRLSFVYGLYQVLMTFKFGGTLILEQSFSYPMDLIDKMIKEKATGLPIVPTMAAILVQMRELSDMHFRHLRYITNAGAHLPIEHIKQIKKIFPNTRLYNMYGLTECTRVSYLPLEQMDIRANSVGKSMPNVDVYIVNQQGDRVAPGEVGELVVRGSNVMNGYLGLPEQTEKALRPGLFPGEKVLYTGDLFKMDEEGYLYFVSRKDDIIKTRGEKVSPKEVESVLYSIPGVSEAAVVGVSHAVWGEIVKAVIVLGRNSKLTKKEIKGHCLQNIEDFMVPQIIEFRSSLPKTGSGKILKRELV